MSTQNFVFEWPSDGDSATVALPIAMASDDYTVTGDIEDVPGGGSAAVLTFPSDGRTTTTFSVVASGSLLAGTTIGFVVVGQLLLLMSQQVTTLTAIRENMEQILAGLVPTTRPSSPFRRHTGNEDLREFAKDNPSTAIRSFIILRRGEYLESEASDMVTERRIGTLELIIAYPRDWSLFSGAEEPDIAQIDDVILEDVAKIEGRSGFGLNGAANYVIGQHRSVITEHSIDEDEKVVFSVFEIEVDFYQSVAA